MAPGRIERMGCSNPISPTFPRTPDGAPSRRGTRTTPRYSPISTPNSRAWFEVRLTRCWRELDSNFQFRAGDGFGFSLPDAHRCAPRPDDHTVHSRSRVHASIGWIPLLSSRRHRARPRSLVRIVPLDPTHAFLCTVSHSYLELPAMLNAVLRPSAVKPFDQLRSRFRTTILTLRAASDDDPVG